jgi:hypothetical protein
VKLRGGYRAPTGWRTVMKSRLRVLAAFVLTVALPAPGPPLPPARKPAAGADAQPFELSVAVKPWTGDLDAW